MTTLSRLTLALGHAASGKSAWAETHVLEAGGRAVYVATAALWDDEMRAKAQAHADRRGAAWTLIEGPKDLADTCLAAQRGDVLLIDCATMWLTGLMMTDTDWQAPATAWIAAMAEGAARYVVVSNDVGGGVAPDNALARRFQRAQGALNQQLASAADRVVLVTAGLPQVLK
ncbi:adenosylcobinamide kinase/adenosylcobinamide phosphate guanyltransferase [Jannaschia pagri]|uniref:Bifunctional adenosylcobalamin biosynthesis protein n=1 Tax=Jannaschia pagri TaxID=2829797 RepID=A0ABQ4NLG7_9RHOB|nr:MULTISPECIES: bifunctional adenosylcobinamide kinase/adenosylcobinamide-phosphate guanylyltransferase [unclassified Jannaschia]GIT91222.1 adenosylcobinamide kinase/adenosylcobinamide phosphate guanyltransferase [Jannaschia sp. AI_61]GIT95054.1 adenosylcobinamide kinase/adenosylcobinamide phosphate guanyltransferase [Jannaschia sp. AI_62]